MQNTSAQELAELRREIDALKAELREIRQFIEIAPENTSAGTPPLLKLKCNRLVILAPDPQSMARLELTAEDTPNIAAFDPNGEPAAEFGIEEGTNRGRLLISDSGNPRAVVKATPTGGCLSVLHDDGRPRASIISTAHNGAELLMITPDLKPGVRASSGAKHGGLITVHRENGTPAITLISGKSTSGIAVKGKEGKTSILP
jgi:hypothetical protein